eukprot:INCI3849.1.p1 GENE.INCI3849.1~~INCI3849.1.p1  ORF type:complete len:192 (-),score=36.58 INCI3849.1:111-626(-)
MPDATSTLSMAGMLNGRATLLSDGKNLENVLKYCQLQKSLEDHNRAEAALAKAKAARDTASRELKEKASAERSARKRQEADKVMSAVFTKLGVASLSAVTSMTQLSQLTVAQVKAVFWTLQDKYLPQVPKQEMLRLLAPLLGIDPELPANSVPVAAPTEAPAPASTAVHTS